MKLNDLYKMSLEEAIKQMNIVDMEVYTNDEGEVKVLDVRYVPVPANKGEGEEECLTLSMRS